MQSSVKNVPIEERMAKSYLEYSMSVITSRALPNVRDGLKPVHRRILWAMYNLKLTADKPFRKCARTIGETHAKYHPHGETAIYDTLVRMAQPFSLRYPLIEGQGNFGSMDGQPAAAQRYTEARMQKIADELLKDIEKETVTMVPNFDGLDMEPTVLPSRIPNLLINGSMGIAVGMATSIPPHNLSEVIDGTIALLRNPDMTIDELMKIIPGPDFPTGGVIFGTAGIRNAYRTGRGNVYLRAKYEIEDIDKRPKIIITEVPYMVKRQDTIEHRGLVDIIQNQKDAGKFPEISSVENQSNIIHGTRIVIHLKSGSNVDVVLNRLFRNTPMQISFSMNHMALVEKKINGEKRLEPKILNLKQLLRHFIDHRIEIVTKRTEYDLRKAKERLHILEGRKIVVDNLDGVISLIRSSSDSISAKKALMKKYSLSEIQSDDILARPLRSLTKMDIEKIIKEYNEIINNIKYFESILADIDLVYDIIEAELLEIKKKYGDKRRTKIIEDASSWLDKSEEDFIQEEKLVIIITQNGYIKSIATEVYNSQRRGGKGVKAMELSKDDALKEMIVASTHDSILFFSRKGKVFKIQGFQIPRSNKRISKGYPISGLIRLDKDDSIQTMIAVSDFSNSQASLVLATKRGLVKKSLLSGYSRVRATGIIGIQLREDDEIVGAKVTTGTDELVLATYKGKAIRFSENNVRSVGRKSIGVIGIRLTEDDYVVDLAVVDEDKTLLTVCRNGYGKRSKFDHYRRTKRGGKGIINIKTTDRNGPVIATRSVSDHDELLLVTNRGKMIQISVNEISIIGRATAGVRLMKLDNENSFITSIAIIENQRSFEQVDELPSEEVNKEEVDLEKEDSNE